MSYIKWYNLNVMKIINAIKTNPKIKKRYPITLKELLKWVNNYMDVDAQKTNDAVRKIFIGNNDYYKLNYKTIKRGMYVPNELLSGKEVIKKIARGRKYKESGITLGYSMNVTSQNPAKETWFIFGVASEEDLYILSFFSDYMQCEFIDIPKDDFEYFSLFQDILILIKYEKKLKDYIKKNKVSTSFIMEGYKRFSNSRYKKNDWYKILDQFPAFFKTLLEALLYAQK